MKRIYLDNAATTPVHPEVLEAMIPYYTQWFGNASTVYSEGQEARLGLETARAQVANLLNCKPSEVYFTGSGTEADNWVIKGVAETLKAKGKGNHIITTKIEHHAVLHTCEYLERHGFEVTYLDVDSEGLISVKDLEAAIKDTTILVSVMHANNEIGTIQPIEEISAILKPRKILFHTDAVQSVGKIPVDVKALGVDFLTLSAHKIYGPKGVGALYIRTGLRFENLIHGGGQERGRRPSTENIAGIVGLGKAAELIAKNLPEERARLEKLRDRLIDGMLAAIPHTQLNGSREHRLPHNANIAYKYVEGESLILNLDFAGVSVSSGSACATGDLSASHVLMAIGLPALFAHGSIRYSLGRETTEEDIDYVISVMPGIVEKLRKMSPVYEG